MLYGWTDEMRELGLYIDDATTTTDHGGSMRRYGRRRIGSTREEAVGWAGY